MLWVLIYPNHTVKRPAACKIAVPKYESDSEDDVPLIRRQPQQRVNEKPLTQRGSNNSSPRQPSRKSPPKNATNNAAADSNSSSSEDDIPLAQRNLPLKTTAIKQESSDSEDDVPLVKFHCFLIYKSLFITNNKIILCCCCCRPKRDKLHLRRLKQSPWMSIHLVKKER